jgi:hypothetical protein
VKKIQVKWSSCNNGEWCDFERVNLDDAPESGVYVIAYDTEIHGKKTSVYVGMGDVKPRTEAHRRGDTDTDKEILACGKLANKTLKLTWAEVSEADAPGVEKYLARVIGHLVGHHHEKEEEIEVNLP